MESNGKTSSKDLVAIHIRLEPWQKLKVQQKAKKRGVSVAQIIRELIENE